MAHKTLIGGTAYEISGGRTLVGGTAYSISGGRTLVNGTGYDISFGVTWKKYNCNVINYYQRDSNLSGVEYSAHIGLSKAVFYSGYSFSEYYGFSLSGKVEMSPENSVGYYYFSSDININKITSVTKSSSGGWDIKYKEVDHCTLHTQYRVGEYIGEVTVDEESLPEEGTLVYGSIAGNECVVRVGDTTYYYEKIT